MNDEFYGLKCSCPLPTVEVTGAVSLTEVIRRALSLYDVVVEHTGEGGKVVFRHRDGEEETLRLI